MLVEFLYTSWHAARTNFFKPHNLTSNTTVFKLIDSEVIEYFRVLRLAEGNRLVITRENIEAHVRAADNLTYLSCLLYLIPKVNTQNISLYLFKH